MSVYGVALASGGCLSTVLGLSLEDVLAWK